MRGGQPGAHGGGICRRVHHQQGCRLGVWDYSRRKGNLLGQICPLYSALWFLLCIPVLPLSRALRERLCQGGSGRRIETA